jgi:putative PIN family toxin of toxin-antitoxin system
VKRVVLDTSILVAGFRSRRGASNAVLELVARRRLIPLATPSLFLEWEDALKRPEHLLASGLSRQQVDRALAALASAIEPVQVHIMWRPQLADPSDEMVIEAAINGRADALVTHNVKDFMAAAPRFRLPVLRPAELLRRVRP